MSKKTLGRRKRCVKLLKPGTGRMCIVLPDGLLGNPDDEYIRVWLLRHCEVLALVDMPVELFLPKVGMQTHLVFLRRKSTDEMNVESLSGRSAAYPIFMAIAKKVGKDRRDNRTYKRDRDGRVLDHFRDVAVVGEDLHEVSTIATVLDFAPEVDQYDDWSYGKTLSESEERLLRPNPNQRRRFAERPS